MATPNAVKKQAAQADEFIKQGGNTEILAAEPENKQKPVEETPVTPVDPEKDKASETEQEQLNKPLGDENDPWEKKYQILQGKYNKEVPALHKEIKSLKDRVLSAADSSELVRLKDENTKLLQQLKEQPSASVDLPGLDQLREDYSSELVDGLLAAVQKMVAPVQDSVNKVNQTVSNVTASSKESELRGILAEKGINYDQANHDPLFVDEWLQEVDVYSGVKRHDLLTNAYKSGDLVRAAKFFEDFSVSHQLNSRNSAKNLERHVSVDSSAAKGDPLPQKNEWSEQRITQFYQDKQRGKYTKEEAEALERELFAFMRQPG